ncbi:MAG: hypothetical protein ACYCYR_16110 [Desulfobulbaceae bacterium]|jgi:hypothetical protein
MKKIVLLLSVLLLAKSALAGGFTTKDECRAFADKLMDHFVAADFQEGLNSAKPYWPIPEVEIDGMRNQISQQWPVVDQRFGKAVGKEFIDETRIGQSFLRYRYLHKFEKHALYWQFDFYKPHGEWVINKITFYDDLDSLFE